MGSVFEGFDPLIDRKVAIKVIRIPPWMTEEELESYRARFYQEARTAGKLHHPAIVTIYDMGVDESSGMPYLVMEYVDGDNLKNLIKENGPFPWFEAVRIAYHVAIGLEYAHRFGIIHRDIKSANIMLTQDQVKITDFGIAHLPESDLTRSGQLLGSPGYMAPEILKNEPLTPKADLFSLGVVLFEALTGHKPFEGESIASVTMKILNSPPLDLASLAPDTPAPVVEIVRELLEKNPNRRITDAGTLVHRLKPMLEHFSDEPEIQAETPAPITDLTLPDLETEYVTPLRTSSPSAPHWSLSRLWSVLHKSFTHNPKYWVLGAAVLALTASLLSLLPRTRSTPPSPTAATPATPSPSKPEQPPSSPIKSSSHPFPLLQPPPPCSLSFVVSFPFDRLDVKAVTNNQVIIERTVYPWKKTILGPVKQIVREVTLKGEIPAGNSPITITLNAQKYHQEVQVKPECKEQNKVWIRVDIPKKSSHPHVTWGTT